MAKRRRFPRWKVRDTFVPGYPVRFQGAETARAIRDILVKGADPAMTTFRYERNKIAKRDHKRRCEMTGVPIEKGDRYFEWAGLYEGDFNHIKAHSVMQDMAHESMANSGEDSWNPQEACEYLLEWLRLHLGEPTWNPKGRWGHGESVDHPEVTACYEAARAYWKSTR